MALRKNVSNLSIICGKIGDKRGGFWGFYFENWSVCQIFCL